MNGMANGDVVSCPHCGNTLGVQDGEALIVKKRGRIVKMTVWEEAAITCEECGTETRVKRHSGGARWAGMLDSRQWKA